MAELIVVMCLAFCLGQLRSRGVEPVVHTKFVTSEAGLSAARTVNQRSRLALGAAPELVAFHWWDFSDRRYVEAAQHLATLRGEGLLRHVAACNFDCASLSWFFTRFCKT